MGFDKADNLWNIYSKAAFDRVNEICEHIQKILFEDFQKNADETLLFDFAKESLEIQSLWEELENSLRNDPDVDMEDILLIDEDREGQLGDEWWYKVYITLIKSIFVNSAVEIDVNADSEEWNEETSFVEVDFDDTTCVEIWEIE